MPGDDLGSGLAIGTSARRSRYLAVARADRQPGRRALRRRGYFPCPDCCHDELIGPGRWTPWVDADGAVVVRFPPQERANAGYHIEGSYDGPGGYWVNVHSRARVLLALLLFTDVGPGDAPTRRSAAHICMSRSSWRHTVR